MTEKELCRSLTKVADEWYTEGEDRPLKDLTNSELNTVLRDIREIERSYEHEKKHRK